MRLTAIFPAWGRILRGYRPFLSVEITKECPLHCPGCYAYEPAHLENGRSLRNVSELRGEELGRGVLAQVRRCRPLHVSFVGGEPLLRYRELSSLIPQLQKMGIEVQIVTSAVRMIPPEWSNGANVHIVVSVDGLKPEHDVRRNPATYDRILRNIAGHSVIIHCTILPEFVTEPSYLKTFAEFWSPRPEVRKIWFSLFTPQANQYPPERLSACQRRIAIARIAELRSTYPKIYASEAILDGYRNPPSLSGQCIFAQITHCVSADLSTTVMPCQIGGNPVCSECGCIAGAGFAAIGRAKVAGISVGKLFAISKRIGERYRGGRT